jgi:hypothetical protein
MVIPMLTQKFQAETASATAQQRGENKYLNVTIVMTCGGNRCNERLKTMYTHMINKVNPSITKMPLLIAAEANKLDQSVMTEIPNGTQQIQNRKAKFSKKRVVSDPFVDAKVYT